MLNRYRKLLALPFQELTVLQQQELRCGLQHGLAAADVRLYHRRALNFLQMAEIRLGLENGLTHRQIRSYAKPWIASWQMRKIRLALEAGLAVSVQQSSLPKIALFSALLAAAGICLRVMLLRRSMIIVKRIAVPAPLPSVSPDRLPPQLKLKQEQIVLPAAAAFACLDYVAAAIDERDGNLLPKVACSSRLVDQPGLQTVEYQVFDAAGNRASALLQVQIQPSASPVQPAPAHIAKAEPTAPPAEPAQPEEPSISEDSGWIYEEIGAGEVNVTHELS